MADREARLEEELAGCRATLARVCENVRADERRKVIAELTSERAAREEEWRCVARDGGEVPGGYERTEAEARSWLPDLDANHPDYAPYRVQRREVFFGPWEDAAAHEEGSTGTREALDELKFGPRSYTAEQADTIKRAVADRRPLTAPALPLDDEEGSTHG